MKNDLPRAPKPLPAMFVGDDLPLPPPPVSAQSLVAGVDPTTRCCLDDHDVAYDDRTSRRLMARLRRWLRKVLGMSEF